MFCFIIWNVLYDIEIRANYCWKVYCQLIAHVIVWKGKLLLKLCQNLNIMIFVLRKILRIVFTITTKGKNEFRNKFSLIWKQSAKLNSWTANSWTRMQGKYLEIKGLQMKFCIYDISLNLDKFLRFIHPLHFQFVRDTIDIPSWVKGTLKMYFGYSVWKRIHLLLNNKSPVIKHGSHNILANP